MSKVFPKGQIDLLKPQLKVSWALTGVLVVIMILGVIGVGTFAYEKVKGVVGDLTSGVGGAGAETF